MKRRHGAGRDAAGEPVAHDQVVAVAELGDEVFQLGEIVAVVAVAHDHVAAARGLDAAAQRCAVSAPRDVDHAGAVADRDFLAAVVAAVVGDYDLAGYAAALEIVDRLVDTDREGLGLVEARHDDRELAILGRGLGTVLRVFEGVDGVCGHLRIRIGIGISDAGEIAGSLRRRRRTPGFIAPQYLGSFLFKFAESAAALIIPTIRTARPTPKRWTTC